MSALNVILGWLHLDEPPVSDAERVEVANLRAEADQLHDNAAKRARQSVGVARYFVRVNDQNHFAERIARARQGR